MFPSFVHPTVLYLGLPLIGMPLVIHLINMMRHRRVEWAAMEFLRQSHERHRTSILLKQMLLLALRVLAVAAVVLMLAQPVLNGQLGSLFGGHNTHHIVLLDDSFSMSDRAAGASAFSQAKQFLKQLAGHAQRQDVGQTFTLLRFSQSARGRLGTQPDLLAESVNRDFPARLEQVLARLEVSQTAAGPIDAVGAVNRLPAQAKDESRIIYLVSDYRAREWEDPAALRKTLARLTVGGAQVRLVNCVDSRHPNLAISHLRPSHGTRAAGVPLAMEVAVKNYGATTARRVAVLLEEDGRSRASITIDTIPAGQTAVRKFPVLFQTVGEHEIAAHLEDDAVAADNDRYAIVDFPAHVSILIIDGDAGGKDAFFVATALSPGGSVTSGIKPSVETRRALRRPNLSRYACIFLLNFERFDPAEVRALEKYVQAGGGVCFFVGELTRAAEVNEQLYRAGKGLFPAPLAHPVDLLVASDEKTPDMQVSPHPIFSVFAGERNSFLDSVNVDRYFAVTKGWKPAADTGARVIARLRNGAPLVVERSYGRGRVLAVLTKASPVRTTSGSWNNWAAGNPSYVVALLEMQAYLAAAANADRWQPVGSSIVVRYSPQQYGPQVRFVLPRKGSALAVDARASRTGLQAELPLAPMSGVYQARLLSADGREDVRRYAVNVIAEEGDLRIVQAQQLAARLAGVSYQYHRAQDVTYDPQQLAGLNISQTLLYLLVGLLLGEQLLASALSYHPQAKGARS